MDSGTIDDEALTPIMKKLTAGSNTAEKSPISTPMTSGQEQTSTDKTPISSPAKSEHKRKNPQSQ